MSKRKSKHETVTFYVCRACPACGRGGYAQPESFHADGGIEFVAECACGAGFRILDTEEPKDATKWMLAT